MRKRNKNTRVDFRNIPSCGNVETLFMFFVGMDSNLDVEFYEFSPTNYSNLTIFRVVLKACFNNKK